jgi:2-methylcitrate dehydratase PrpD
VEKVLVPKEEVDGGEEMEVIEVPSGSEDEDMEEMEVDEEKENVSTKKKVPQAMSQVFIATHRAAEAALL